MGAIQLLVLGIAGSAAAQKYPGTTLEPSYPPSVPRVAPLPVPVPSFPAPARPAAPLEAAAPETDSEARQLANRLPLDPATRDLRNRLPDDVPGTIRRLGLRVPNGTRTDLRSHTPTTREIINALVH